MGKGGGVPVRWLVIVPEKREEREEFVGMILRDRGIVVVGIISAIYRFSVSMVESGELRVGTYCRSKGRS